MLFAGIVVFPAAEPDFPDAKSDFSPGDLIFCLCVCIIILNPCIVTTILLCERKIPLESPPADTGSSVKKKIIFVVLLLMCFIPTAVAVSSYYTTQNAPVDEKTAVRLTVTDLNEKEYTFAKSDGESAQDMIRFFLAMQQNAASIVGLPDSLTGELFFKVTLSTNVKDATYRYYFNPDPSMNYFLDPSGAAFKIREADAAAFITTEYAESIYSSSAMPVLTLSNTYAVTPDSAVWQYKNYTGAYVDSDVSGAVSADVESYSLEGGFDLSFDVQPDYFALKITDGSGNTLFDDMYDRLSSDFTFESNTSLNVSVIARWFEDPARSFCGELDYEFTSLVTAPAEFYLGVKSVKLGGFTSITGLNVLNPERIQFTCEPSLDFTPTFYKEGDYVVAILPVDATLTAGTYNMTLVYGGSTQTLSLNVEAKDFQSSNINVSSTMLNMYRTSETISAFEKVRTELTAASSDVRYFSGSFLSSPATGATLLRGFGREIVLNGDTNNKYRNNGVDFALPSGTNILAANDGVVVYSGILDYTGCMVVVDHGFGVKTWYYNMAKTSVSVGDTVKKGDAVGTAGNTGFVAFDSTGVHIAMSVGDKFVCPYDAWDDSKDYGKITIWGIDD